MEAAISSLITVIFKTSFQTAFFLIMLTSSLASLITDLNANKNLWISQSFFKNRPLLTLFFAKFLQQKNFHYILRPFLKKLYILSETSDEKGPVAIGISIRNEFIYRVILAINRLDSILSDTNLSIAVQTYNRLLDRILRGLSIPFSGEPLNGVQIMGSLKPGHSTFRNLIYLSVNEGVIPTKFIGQFIYTL